MKQLPPASLHDCDDYTWMYATQNSRNISLIQGICQAVTSYFREVRLVPVQASKAD